MESEDSWPKPFQDKIFLEGFSFNQLGGFEGSVVRNVFTDGGARDQIWWDEWAKAGTGREDSFVLAPYTQLAAAFSNAGLSETVEKIKTLSRDRERQHACDSGWKGLIPVLSADAITCPILWGWKIFGAYNIGYRSVAITVLWVLAFVLAGAIALFLAATDEAKKARSNWWWLKASFFTMVPGYERKDVTEFLGDHNNLKAARMPISFTLLNIIALVVLAPMLLAGFKAVFW